MHLMLEQYYQQYHLLKVRLFMSSYSIKDLEILTGVKAHTLRIWEQRYNLIAPQRTDTNIRQYTSDDLKLLLNVSLLNDNGFKISKIASLPSDIIKQEVLNISEKNTAFDNQIQLLTLSMIDVDEARFDQIMQRNITKLGLEKTMIHIVFPFFVKIGVMWQTDTISASQEHFITNLLKQKIFVAIDSQNDIPLANASKFLLFLADGELHELSLLFTNYIIKSRLHKTIYLGQSLPLEDLNVIYKKQKPQFIVTVLTVTPKECSVQEYVLMLGSKFPESTILISGSQVVGQDLKITSNTIILNKIDDLIDLLEEL